MDFETSDLALIFMLLIVTVAAALLIGECMHTVHTEQLAEMQLKQERLKLQAEGKIPPDGTIIHKLDEEQLKELISAFSK